MRASAVVLQSPLTLRAPAPSQEALAELSSLTPFVARGYGGGHTTRVRPVPAREHRLNLSKLLRLSISTEVRQALP